MAKPTASRACCRLIVPSVCLFFLALALTGLLFSDDDLPSDVVLQQASPDDSTPLSTPLLPAAPTTNVAQLHNLNASLSAALGSDSVYAISWDDVVDSATDVIPRAVPAPSCCTPEASDGVLAAAATLESARSPHSSDEPQSSAMGALMQCCNEVYTARHENWTTALSDGQLPALKVVGVLWAGANNRTNVSTTLVTTCNLARLDQLEAQCRAWPGVLSVAVHIAVLQDEPGNLTAAARSEVRTALMQVANLLSEMHHTPSACSLRVVLAVEVYTDPRAMILFPVNELRNLARLQADTPLIALLDVNLLPSASLYTRVADQVQGQDLVDQGVLNNTVYVVPGFEVHTQYELAPWAHAVAPGGKVASTETLLSGGKEVMSAAYKQGVVVAFHVDRYPAGHTPTNYSLWMDTDKDYPVEHQAGYEPWLIGARVGMPWHDARYRGFGKNKVQHILNLNQLNYTFTVLHDAFALHRPHEPTSAEVAFLTRVNRKAGAGQKNELKMRMVGLLDSQEAAGPGFKPALSAVVTNCQQKLAWWAQYDASADPAPDWETRMDDAEITAEEIARIDVEGAAKLAVQLAQTF